MKTNEEEYKTKLKSLLRTLNLEKWEESLSDDNFVNFLSNYVDDKFNNVYHLLFSKKLSTEAIYSCNKIVELLITKNIPTIGMNINNKLSYELAAGKSVYALNILKNQVNKEYNKQQLEYNIE